MRGWNAFCAALEPTNKRRIDGCLWAGLPLRSGPGLHTPRCSASQPALRPRRLGCSSPGQSVLPKVWAVSTTAQHPGVAGSLNLLQCVTVLCCPEDRENHPRTETVHETGRRRNDERRSRKWRELSKARLQPRFSRSTNRPGIVLFLCGRPPPLPASRSRLAGRRLINVMRTPGERWSFVRGETT